MASVQFTSCGALSDKFVLVYIVGSLTRILNTASVPIIEIRDDSWSWAETKNPDWCFDSRGTEDHSVVDIFSSSYKTYSTSGPATAQDVRLQSMDLSMDTLCVKRLVAICLQ